MPFRAVARYVQKGIIFIKDITTNNRLMTFIEICAKFGTINWLWYQSLVQAIPKTWKCNTILANQTNSALDLRIITEMKKSSKIIYSHLINKRAFQCIRKMEVYMCKWNEICDDSLEEIESFQWLVVSTRKITKVIKLRNFQYRLYYGKTFCNDQLVHWGKAESAMCNLCNKAKQDIRHLYLECECTQIIWEYFKRIFCDSALCWEYRDIMENSVHPKSTHVINLIILIAKQFIYCKKCMNEKLQLHELTRKIHSFYLKEKYINPVQDKWAPIAKIFLFQL